ncbi:MAG TPA: GNAT family protein [Candidatus Lustribacter sp.]|nr:GNAT family protein [Candidatus Lustribacter sp.]
MAQPQSTRTLPTGPSSPVPLGSTDSTILLGEFRTSDMPALKACFADRETAVWNPGPADGDVAAWIALRNDWSDGAHLSWAVRGADGLLLGSLSIFKLDTVLSSAQVGYFVFPGHRGYGVARRALALGVPFTFAERDIHRLELFHAVENGASCSVATAAGFPLEGVLRQSYVYADGLRHDEHLHARLATDPIGGTDPVGARARGRPESTGR